MANEVDLHQRFPFSTGDQSAPSGTTSLGLYFRSDNPKELFDYTYPGRELQKVAIVSFSVDRGSVDEVELILNWQRLPQKPNVVLLPERGYHRDDDDPAQQIEFRFTVPSTGHPDHVWYVQNDDPDLVLANVAFPLIFVLSSIGERGEDDVLVFSQLDGFLLRNPSLALDNGGLFALYPADLSLQMMANYDGESGLYLAAHDPNGQVKSFAYAPLPWEGQQVTLLAVNRSVPEVGGQDYSPDYPVLLGPFQGDWYDAAMLYKGWAVQQSWIPQTLSERSDVPAIIIIDSFEF